MKRILFITMVLAASVVAINVAMAATTTYTCKPMADTRIDQRDANLNFGTGTTLKMVGDSDGTEVCRVIIRLNIPPFISANQIQSAYLHLTARNGGAEPLDINIHPITPPAPGGQQANWFEKPLSKPDATQIIWGSTWYDYGGESSGLAWTNPGGDFDAGQYASGTVATGPNSIDITTLLTDNLDTIRKYGMLLKVQDESLDVYKTVYSRENATGQPYLELNVDLGLPATTYMCPNIGDVYIDESLSYGEHNLNFNWKTRVMVTDHPTKGRARGLWKFEIPGGIQAGDIKCARLFLSGSEHAFKTNQFLIDFFALDAPFNEETVTWDTLAGGGYDTSVVSSGTIYQTLYGDPAINWRAGIDLTDLLAGNLVKVRDNGMLMREQVESGKKLQHIASRECYGESDVAAYLLIDSANTCDALCFSDGDCDDGVYCNGVETCVAYTCQPGTPVDCPDDGLFCNGNEFCDEAAKACASSGDPCTEGTFCNEDTDSCDPIQCITDEDCDDGIFCNGVETCVAHICQPGTPVECPDDGIFCNGNEFCDEAAKACAGSGDPCTEGTFCNEDTDSCDPIQCTNDEDCDDGIFCNGVETCVAYTCQPGTPVDCPDDGLFCNGDEFCDEDAKVCGSSGDPCAPLLCDEENDRCIPLSDMDGDGIPDIHDNCPVTPNPGQEDSYPPGGNGIGDACECEGDFTCDGDVDGSDVLLFKSDFGRNPHYNPCTGDSPCNGDFNCDGDVDGGDTVLFKADFGRSGGYYNPCPECVAGDWCDY